MCNFQIIFSDPWICCWLYISRNANILEEEIIIIYCQYSYPNITTTFRNKILYVNEFSFIHSLFLKLKMKQVNKSNRPESTTKSVSFLTSIPTSRLPSTIHMYERIKWLTKEKKFANSAEREVKRFFLFTALRIFVGVSWYFYIVFCCFLWCFGRAVWDDTLCLGFFISLQFLSNSFEWSIWYYSKIFRNNNNNWDFKHVSQKEKARTRDFF